MFRLVLCYFVSCVVHGHGNVATLIFITAIIIYNQGVYTTTLTFRCTWHAMSTRDKDIRLADLFYGTDNQTKVQKAIALPHRSTWRCNGGVGRAACGRSRLRRVAVSGG